jgi:hypothetical protein
VPASTFEIPTAPASPPPQRRQQVRHGGLDLDDLGLGRPSAPHRDDDDAAIARHDARHVSRHGCLPHALAGADHRDGRRPDRLEARWVEPEVGPLVRHAERQGTGGEPESRRRAEHGLIGEIEHEVRRMLVNSRLERRRHRHAVVLSPTQLLRAADEHARDDLLR